MKLKEGYVLRTICGETILSPEGLSKVDMSRIISLNETAAFLWKTLQDRDFTAKDAVELLTGEYDVDEETASKDVDALIAKWQEIGLI